MSRVLLAAAIATAPLVSGIDVIDNVNQRFQNGKATDDLAAAGIILHHFSSSHAVALGEPWRPYTQEECDEHHYHGCGTTADRACTLISNNQVRNPEDNSIPVYSTSVGGIIFNPNKSKVMCAYSQDGGTDDRASRGCDCHNGDVACEQRKTKNSCVLDVKAGVEDYNMCWWGPQDLQQMMTRQKGVYNEVVLDTDVWANDLPGSIEAFFYVKGAEKLADTLEAYTTFQAKYPDACVPILEMDINAADTPFSYSKMASNAKTHCKADTTSDSEPEDDGDDSQGDDAPSSATNVWPSWTYAILIMLIFSFVH